MRPSPVGRGVPACYASAMGRRDRKLARENNAVRYLLGEASGFLSADRVAEAEELLRVAEPELALEFMAWELASRRDELPEHLVRFITDEVSDMAPMPPAFQA
jgi:hypothetical protein